MVKCSNCESEVGESIFCHNCGTKMPKSDSTPQETNTKKNYCPNCGSEVEESKFCTVERSAIPTTNGVVCLF